MSREGVRAVLLDLDDTLYEEHSYFASGLQALANWLGDGAEKPSSEWHKWLLDDVRVHGRNGVIDRIPVSGSCTVEAWRLALLSIYRSHQPRLSLFSDVSEFIARCRTENVFLAIVTDGKSCVQWRKLQALGLDTTMDMVLCTDDIDSSKPSVDPFLAVCGRLRIPASSCVYLGDDAYKDFIGPHALGMTSIQVVRRLAFPLARAARELADEADFQVDGLAAASTLLFGETL